MENTPVKFDIYEGDTLVRSEILTEQTIKIGKLSSSHVRLDHESVSRMHAVVEVNGPDDVVVLDLGSATGTFVNGERCTKRSLRTGDQLTLGDLRVVVTIAGQTQAAASAPAAVAAPAQNIPLFDDDEEVPGAARSLEVLSLVGNTVLTVRHSSQRSLDHNASSQEASSSAMTGGLMLAVAVAMWIGLGEYAESLAAMVDANKLTQAEMDGRIFWGGQLGLVALALAAMWFFARAAVFGVIRKWIDGPGEYGRDGTYTIGTQMARLGTVEAWICRLLMIDTPEAWGPDQFVGDAVKLPSDPHPLAETDGSNITVNIPDGIDGDVLLDGEVHKLAEMREAGQLRKGGPGYATLRLPDRARCRLEFGDQTFLVNSVVDPGALKIASPTDWQGHRYKLASAILHALFFVIILSLPEDADSLSLDGFDMGDRFVEFILKPEEEKQEKLDDLFKDLDDGKAAEKAKEEEGKLGKKEEKDQNKRFAVKGPEDQEAIKLAKEKARAEALSVAAAAFQLEGELSAVWGEGDRAVGSDAVSALGNMFGDRVGDAQGFGGLGGVGVGRGGGGFGENSIGVGNVGTMGRGGRGNSGYGRGASRLGERRAKVPKVIPGKPIISGSLDMETIRRVIRRHRNEYRYCYEKQLNTKRDLNGKITVKFTIAGNGSVIAAAVADTTMNDRKVEGCLVTKIKRWVFPAPKGGGIVIVKYPFVFKAS